MPKSCSGVNTMLDAILLPIGEGNRILGQVSNGKVDELIAQTYKGDHEKMKQSDQQHRARGAGPPDGTRPSDRSLQQARPALRPWQAGAVSRASTRRLSVGINTDARCDPAADREGNRILRLISGGNLREKVDNRMQG